MHVYIYLFNLFNIIFFYLKLLLWKRNVKFLQDEYNNFCGWIEIKWTCDKQKDARSCFSRISNHRIFYKVKTVRKERVLSSEASRWNKIWREVIIIHPEIESRTYRLVVVTGGRINSRIWKGNKGLWYINLTAHSWTW